MGIDTWSFKRLWGATAIELAKEGINIFGVHFDRAATMPQVHEVINEIKLTV